MRIQQIPLDFQWDEWKPDCTLVSWRSSDDFCQASDIFSRGKSFSNPRSFLLERPTESYSHQKAWPIIEDSTNTIRFPVRWMKTLLRPSFLEVIRWFLPSEWKFFQGKQLFKPSKLFIGKAHRQAIFKKACPINEDSTSTIWFPVRWMKTWFRPGFLEVIRWFLPSKWNFWKGKELFKPS